jgi:NADPH2:quinone reductase
MKAIRVRAFGGPDALRLDEMETPAPGAGEVRVKLGAAGVNPVDTYILTGTYARKPSLPYTPGTDGAGVVDAAGEGVSRVAVGDRVYVATLNLSATGTYAEAVVCQVESVHPLPAHVTFAQGAAIGVPATTAWRGLVQRGQARPAETVLVHGASGSVGLAAVQLAVAAGLTVIGTAGSERGRALVAAQGAHHVLDRGSQGYRDEIRRLTDDRGPDLILEMLANVNLAHDLELVAPRGRIVVIGSRGPIEILPRWLMARDSIVTGLTLWNMTSAERQEAHAGLSAALAARTLRPIVAEEIPLADAPRAHERVMQPGAAGKIVLTM